MSQFMWWILWLTDEFKSKLSKGKANFNRLSKSKKLYFTNIETDTKLEFSSWREAAVKLKISRNTIKKFIKLPIY
jgi:NUMOD1 domain-containing protein